MGNSSACFSCVLEGGGILSSLTLCFWKMKVCYLVPHIRCPCLMVTRAVVWRMSSSQTSTTHNVRIASKSHVQQTL